MAPATPPFIRRSAVLPAVLHAVLHAVLFGVALILQPTLSSAQATPRCSEAVTGFLQELPLDDGEVKSVRIIERTNIADDFGPEIFGVDAWVRLNSCSGYLVLNLSKGCFLRQAYTRGDCEVGDLSNY